MRNALKDYKHDSRRKIVLKPGLISFQDTSISCFVLNISTGGAGLVLESDFALPSAFDLEISGERIHHRCLLVWRNDRQIGVVFDLDQCFGPSRRKSGDPDVLAATLEMER
jgi:hypothetical protein